MKVVQVNVYILQTDRPVSEYWNSGMVQALRDLAMEFKVNFVHFTEQAHHNKVSRIRNKVKKIKKKFYRIKLMVSFLDTRMP